MQCLSVNGIFYMVVERVEHYFDVCSGQLIVTCVVGKTEIPIHQETFNRCTSQYYSLVSSNAVIHEGEITRQ
jgi:hypothetical protein